MLSAATAPRLCAATAPHLRVKLSAERAERAERAAPSSLSDTIAEGAATVQFGTASSERIVRSCDKRAGTSPAYASRLWKGRSVSSRATGNGPAFCECFVCANKCTAKYRASCCDWLIEAARSTWTSRVDMETTTQQINTTAHMDTHTHTHTHNTDTQIQTDRHTHTQIHTR